MVRDTHMVSPFAYRERQWCGYDDVQSVETKVKFHCQLICLYSRKKTLFCIEWTVVDILFVLCILSSLLIYLLHISKQASYIVSLGLAGAMVWSIETDDFHGNCHAGPFPLITTIRTVLRDGKPIPTPTPPPTPTPTPEPETTTVRNGRCILLEILTWLYV